MGIEGPSLGPFLRRVPMWQSRLPARGLSQGCEGQVVRVAGEVPGGRREVSWRIPGSDGSLFSAEAAMVI